MTHLTRKVVQISVDHDGNDDNYRIKSQSAGIAFRYTFSIPSDFTHLISATLYGNITPGAAQTDRDIDRYISAHQPGQVVNQKTASDTTTLFDLSTFANKTYAFEITTLIPTPTAGDIVGLKQDHGPIGGGVNYFQIALAYC